MRHVSIVGVPGSGKSTFARLLAKRIGATHIELDAIFHQQGWTDLPADEFIARVDEAIGRNDETGWVVDGNYAAVRELVWDRADTIVWLDFPRWLVMRRLVLRTVRRAVTREELWNGNREPLSNFYRFAPEKNVIRWSWVKYADYKSRYEDAMGKANTSGITFVRLTSKKQVDDFLEDVLQVTDS